jgi:hypothetical protein
VREVSRYFFEKSNQKTFAPPAFEWPQYGRSKAGGAKAFCALFFKKALLS